MSDLPPPPPPPPSGGYGAPAGPGGTPPLAEIGPRVIAFLIDFVAIPFVGFIAILIVGGIFGAVNDGLGALIGIVGYLALVGFSFWNIYQEGTTGQSVGKKSQGIKLVGLENGGQPIGFAMAFVRGLVNGIPCSLGWVLPFFDAQRQTLGDKVTKSVVVPA